MVPISGVSILYSCLDMKHKKQSLSLANNWHPVLCQVTFVQVCSLLTLNSKALLFVNVTFFFFCLGTINLSVLLSWVAISLFYIDTEPFSVWITWANSRLNLKCQGHYKKLLGMEDAAEGLHHSLHLFDVTAYQLINCLIFPNLQMSAVSLF